MDHIGIDVHKRESQICIITDDGEVIEQRIRTTRDRFRDTLGARPASRVLLEASTESEWVARELDQLGHEVIVADPNFLPMYGTRRRRIKTDRRDARALADACQNGIYRLAQSGTLLGAPAGARVNIYGNPGLFHPPGNGGADEPLPFSFSVPEPAKDEELVFTAVAFNTWGIVTERVARFSVRAGDSTDLEVEMKTEVLRDLTVTTNVPVLDGEPLTSFSNAYSYALALPYIGNAHPTGFTNVYEINEKPQHSR